MARMKLGKVRHLFSRFPRSVNIQVTMADVVLGMALL